MSTGCENNCHLGEIPYSPFIRAVHAILETTSPLSTNDMHCCAIAAFLEHNLSCSHDLGEFMSTPHFAPDITDDLVRVHEQYLVPAIYSQWASRVADIAEIEVGQEILDVACGTGSLARAAQLETGLKGKVVGLDSSDKMLAAARQHSQSIEWRLGDAALMPFGDGCFDRVMCQFSFMFITNRVATIKEMLRVCKPGGLVIVAIWGPLQPASAYDDLIKMIRQISGEHVARKIAVPWDLGKPGVMDSLLISSGVNEYECHERAGLAKYESMQAFLEAHLRLAGEYDKMDLLKLAKVLETANKQLHSHLAADKQLITQLNARIFKIRPD